MNRNLGQQFDVDGYEPPSFSDRYHDMRPLDEAEQRFVNEVDTDRLREAAGLTEDHPDFDAGLRAGADAYGRLTPESQKRVSELGFGADFLNEVGPDEEDLIDSFFPDGGDEDRWNSGFATGIERGQAIERAKPRPKNWN